MPESEKKIILLIDDDVDQLVVLQTLFEEEGFVVVTAESAQQGLKKLENEKIDCVVSDIAMPGMDGRELVKCIRALSQVPVVAITAAFEDVGEEMLSLGANLFILKRDLSRRMLKEIRSLIEA